jgi:xanthine dehydrogenase small subunit
MDHLSFTLNGQSHDVRGVSPNVTLLAYLRETLGLTGTKEGCAEGDCGACTVVMLVADAPGGPAYHAVNACLLLLPMVHGRTLFTVEGLKTGETPHPAQSSLVKHLGSQCGYCTPGVVMSMFEATYRADLDQDWQLDDQMCGNLCRCTGYRPIRTATQEVAGTCPKDRFQAALTSAETTDRALEYEANEQRFAMPTSFDALWQARAATPDAVLVNGGTDLGLRITKAFETLPELISLEAIDALTRLEVDAAGTLVIGGGVRLSALESYAEDAAPMLTRMLRYFGARQIKHRATVAGNLCTASPIGDLAPAFLALGAQVSLRGPKGARTLPLSEFFTGYRQTMLADDEILEAVLVPPAPAGDVRSVAYKVSKRQELDISTVACGLWVHLDNAGTVLSARFGFGGMAAIPARAKNAEDLVIGKLWSAELAAKAGAALSEDFKPMDDHRGSAWYRSTVAKNLIVGFYEETAVGGSPAMPYRPVGTVVPPEVR